VAVASAGPYASLQLAPDIHTSTPPLCFYRPDALPAAQPTVSKHIQGVLIATTDDWTDISVIASSSSTPLYTQLLLLLHPFIGLFSRTTWVSRYQKGKTSLDLNDARDDRLLGGQ